MQMKEKNQKEEKSMKGGKISVKQETIFEKAGLATRKMVLAALLTAMLIFGQIAGAAQMAHGDHVAALVDDRRIDLGFRQAHREIHRVVAHSFKVGFIRFHPIDGLCDVHLIARG